MSEQEPENKNSIIYKLYAWRRALNESAEISKILKKEN
jgi:hypothetical protein